jgi:hypothetical protein
VSCLDTSATRTDGRRQNGDAPIIGTRRHSGVLLVGAAVVKFALVPALSKLPSDTDPTFQHSGTGTLLNATALKAV